MQMIARIRTIVEVPFEYDVEPADANGYSPGRAESADYANTTVVQQVTDALTGNTQMVAGSVVMSDLTLVEEVREAVQPG